MTRPPSRATSGVCPLCENDGYVEQWTADDHVLTYECPRLNDPGHAPFNATGILDSSATVGALDSPEAPDA